ncbi:MAG: flavodoxin family protein [Ruminococcus sp.]|nr:flavodoxin family protein [Ruminococcus sp.]
MKVLGISGSTRKDGNTVILINTFFEELHKENIETEFIQFADSMIEPCKACWACGGRENCVHCRDIFADTFQKMKEADGIVFGSPVYSANVSANMQTFLERAAVVADTNPGLFTYKVGAALAVERRAGAMIAMDTMHHFFLNHEMYVVGANYWSVACGQLPGDVLKANEGIQTIRNLSKNMAFLLKILKDSR